MNTQQKKTKAIRPKHRPITGKYPSAEAASAAKIARADPYIANIDMTIFKKNGLVE